MYQTGNVAQTSFSNMYGQDALTPRSRRLVASPGPIQGPWVAYVVGNVRHACDGCAMEDEVVANNIGGCNWWALCCADRNRLQPCTRVNARDLKMTCRSLPGMPQAEIRSLDARRRLDPRNTSWSHQSMHGVHKHNPDDGKCHDSDCSDSCHM